MKVGVNIGLTLCTDPENRNFARFGFDIADIDTEGDVEAQAKEGVLAAVQVLGISNDGLEVSVKESLADLSSVSPEGITEDISTLRTTVTKISKQSIPKIVEQVKKLTTDVGELKAKDVKLR